MKILQKLEKLETAFFHTHIPTQDQFLCLGLRPLGCTLRERVNADTLAPYDLPSLTILAKTLLMKVLDFHEKQICHGGESRRLPASLGAAQCCVQRTILIGIYYYYYA